QLSMDQRERIFDTFDFIDVYRVGHSLLTNTRRRIKEAITQTPFEQDDFSYFLGMYWNAFLDNSEEEITKYKFDGSSRALEIRDVQSWLLWNQAVETFSKAVPFVLRFFQGVQKLKKEGLLNDQFYLNFEVDNIDFEAIM